jgi:hypothetical protein
MLAIADWLIERPLTFSAGAENHEDTGDGEPDDNAEVGGGPSRRRPSSLAAPPMQAGRSAACRRA